jgi:hypothetical protein
MNNSLIVDLLFNQAACPMKTSFHKKDDLLVVVPLQQYWAINA